MTSSRRQFLRRTAAGLAWAGVAGGSSAALGSPQSSPLVGAPAAGQGMARKEEANPLKAYNIWDVHCHLLGFQGATLKEKVDTCLRFADRMGVERMLMLTTAPFGDAPDPGKLHAGNEVTVQAVKMAPDRFFGCAFMYPVHLQACLDEINRCIRDGPLIGLKFESDSPNFATSGELDPIFARAAEVNAVIMHYTWIKTTGQDVGEITPMDLVAAAKRHPTVPVFCGHTGGTWELGIRPLRGVKNVYADLSGSDPIAGYTEMAVRKLGAECVLYGSDIGGRSFASQIGKVMGADITDSQRRLILGENMRRILRPVLKSRGINI